MSLGCIPPANILSDMSQSSKITNLFKRPKFAVTVEDNQLHTPLGDPASSSPLTNLSQLLPPDITTPETPDGPSSQLNQTLFHSARESVDNDPVPQSSFQSAGTGTSFGSSQRMIKNGKEVVIGSDGEESDSTGPLASAEDLLRKFARPKSPQVRIMENSKMKHELSKPAQPLRARKIPKPRSTPKAPPVYKNTLASLVQQAVADQETEAEIERLRASIKAREAAKQNGPGLDKDTGLHEGVLASALDDGADDNSMGFQRLLDAVRRTEAFDLEKSWSFFDLQIPLPPGPDFPRECVMSKPYLAGLREPESRERAFYSGIIDFILSKELLPDDVVRWIFYSVPSEPQDSLRNAYCRAFKHTTAGRMKSLIRTEDIDTLFWQMSARPDALALSDPIEPDPELQIGDPPQSQPQHHKALLSVLEIFRDSASIFKHDTREHILKILLRLPLDASLTRHHILCSEIERTISALLESVADNATSICDTLHTTIKDTVLQSRVLEHIIPTNDWITKLRRRLAFIFLTGDPSADACPKGRKSVVIRIINILKDPRFDVRRHKKKGQPEYDYGALKAITTFLNIIIDSGWSETPFPDENIKNEFNRAVDILSERVKKIFTAIEDSGAAYLNRTLAKEALESLHYRVIYAVRTEPPPKRSLFESYDPEPVQKVQKPLDSWLKPTKPTKVVAFRGDKPGS
ncbi:hypothetical protein BJX99DRAFT_236849 [Aspergillus californicus]